MIAGGGHALLNFIAYLCDFPEKRFYLNNAIYFRDMDVLSAIRWPCIMSFVPEKEV